MCSALAGVSLSLCVCVCVCEREREREIERERESQRHGHDDAVGGGEVAHALFLLFLLLGLIMPHSSSACLIASAASCRVTGNATDQ